MGERATILRKLEKQPQQQQQQQQHQIEHQKQQQQNHRKCHHKQQQQQQLQQQQQYQLQPQQNTRKQQERSHHLKLQEQQQLTHKNSNNNNNPRGQKQQQQQHQKQQHEQQPTKNFTTPSKQNGATSAKITTKTTTAPALHHKWRTWWPNVANDITRLVNIHSAAAAAATASAATTTIATTAKTKRKSLTSWLWLTAALLLTATTTTAAATSTAAGAGAATTATTTAHLAAAAAVPATYAPPYNFPEDEPPAESPALAAAVSDENSNEQQLLAYYAKAQQEQQQQQQLQRQRVAPPLPTLTAATVAAVGVDFDDIVPTADVVSTLSFIDLAATRRAGGTATKRSAMPATSTSTAATGAATSTNAAAEAAAIATSPAPSAAPPEEKCEPRVLDEVPTEPYYDFTDIAEDAARQFTEFLANKFPASTAAQSAAINDQLREEVRRRANGIASYALNEDDNLLAFAIAAPSIHTVVVKFRDNVTIPSEQVHNKAFLGSYWRELGYAWNSSDGAQEWGAPFRDCNLLKGRWLWPFRISFTEYKIKIVAAAFIAADEDVCNDGLEDIFGRRHGCERNTTFCLLTENKPAATRDVYTCICREGFYLPNSTVQGFRGDLVELSEGFDNYSCIPCPGGCSSCDQNGVCLFGEPQEVVSLENLFKVSVGSVLGACILCCVVLGVLVFQQRKCKAIASGMWTVLETILLGIVLLYASVAVHFFPASTERCLLEPWLRELGFITCYGAIILKLYRHLVDFRTRKAHRWVLRDVDLLKYLGTMVFAVVCYMAAFTASSLDLLETAKLESLREVRTNTCHPLKWEFVTQTSELLILCFGLDLAYASRTATTQFRERQFLVSTLLLEFCVSTTFYVLRFIYLQEMSPSAIFLALFLRSQMTNTISLGLIFVPKLWYQHKQGSHDAGQRLGGGYAGLCLGDPDIGELTISEMSPEDIRAELKRLYTQLEILKNKTLRQDNPHISKRRGGRKAGHRRFSLQALSAKHRSNKHHQDVEITEAEPSRTPEDSVCSNEGPTDTYAEVSGISHSMLSHSAVSHSVVSHSK